MKETEKANAHIARLKEQAGEITERMQSAGLTLEEAASILRLKVDTLRKYARGYQPASDRVMELIREHIVPPGRHSPHDNGRVSEDAPPMRLAAQDIATLVDILTQDHTPAELSAFLNQVLNDVEMSAAFRSQVARMLGKSLDDRLRSAAKK